MYNEIIKIIRDIYNSNEFIPLHIPYFNGNEKMYLQECIDTNFVSSIGKYVDKFEEIVEQYTGAKKAIACVNGTSALHMALKVVGVLPNEEVITQALTFIATANAISYCGAHPVFLDVDKETMGLSPNSVEKWLKKNAIIKNGKCFNIKSGRKISACVPMHTFGHPVKIIELANICAEYNIELVEDSAESLGSFYNGSHTGTFGKVGVLSFNGNKTITTGGGGMLLFNDEELAKVTKHLTTQAKIPHKWNFKHDSIGYNYRMPNINAALGCAQLENIEYILRKKRETAMLYKEFFSHLDYVEFFQEANGCKSNYWLNAIILKNRSERDIFLKISNDQGVMTRPIWSLMCDLKMFENCQKDDLKNSRWLEERVVNIPSSVIR